MTLSENIPYTSIVCLWGGGFEVLGDQKGRSRSCWHTEVYPTFCGGWRAASIRPAADYRSHAGNYGLLKLLVALALAVPLVSAMGMTRPMCKEPRGGASSSRATRKTANAASTTTTAMVWASMVVLAMSLQFESKPCEPRLLPIRRSLHQNPRAPPRSAASSWTATAATGRPGVPTPVSPTDNLRRTYLQNQAQTPAGSARVTTPATGASCETTTGDAAPSCEEPTGSRQRAVRITIGRPP